MDIFKVVISSLISIIALFLLAKLVGNRQLSQLSMFEYINGITIGSIAAEMATSLEGDIFIPLTAMIIYGVVTAILSVIADKSIYMRRVLNGKSAVLYHNGDLYMKNLKKSKLDINEFLTRCRMKGFYDISQINTAIMEQNGEITIFPTETDRPLTPADMGMSPKKAELGFSVIINGQVLERNLMTLGFDIMWLKNKLKTEAVDDIHDVLLGVCNKSGELVLYKKNDNCIDGDIFM